MNHESPIFEEVSGLYRIIPLQVLRRTPGVSFDLMPMEVPPRIDAIDRVLHEHGATSPGAVGNVARPWYMHCHQDDNLLVVQGIRHIDLYTRLHGRIENFVVAPDKVLRDGRIVYDGPAMLVWPRGVFHRVQSDKKTGSSSVNFAVRYEGFDIDTNFNIYDLDPATGESQMIRAGHLDQPSG